jgi:biopolymer transport protein ExbB/TolQ
MSFTPSQRPTREWPWLVLALALVGVICIPLWQYSLAGRIVYKLTEKELDELKDSMPDATWAKLAPLKDKTFDREPFVAELTRVLSPAERKEYQDLLVTQATTRAVDESWRKWTPERLSRLFLGPEQMVCYAMCTWAGFILFSRWLEVRRQYRAFGLNLLDTDAGACILPEDARLLQRRIEQKTARGGPYILVNMIRLALGKYAVSRSGRDVSETIRTQADVDLGRLVSSMATVHYLAWAIPAIGFLGTVRGLATSLTLGGETQKEITVFIKEATAHLNVAFDCTLIALALSLIVMFLLHSVQRDEEALVIDCQQYCLEHLVGRLYDLEPEHQEQAAAAL